VAVAAFAAPQHGLNMAHHIVCVKDYVAVHKSHTGACSSRHSNEEIFLNGLRLRIFQMDKPKSPA
jgi:hypothetical protein